MDDLGGESEREVDALRREFDQYVRDRVGQLLAGDVQRAARAETERLKAEVERLRAEVADLKNAVRALAGRAPRAGPAVAQDRFATLGLRERLGVGGWPRGRTTAVLASVAVVVALLLTAAVLLGTGVLRTSPGPSPTAETFLSEDGPEEAARLGKGLETLRAEAPLVRQLCGEATPCDFPTIWGVASPDQKSELFNLGLARLESACGLTAASADLQERLAATAQCLGGSLPPGANPGQEEARTRWVLARLGSLP